MLTFPEILREAEQLPAAEKWQMVRQLLRSLEQEQQPDPDQLEWKAFLEKTFGSLRETPIQRWDQGDYEEREPIE